MKTFDEVLKELGQFGTYQKRVLALMLIAQLPIAFNILMSLFSLGSQKHRCAIPGYVNDSYEIQSDYHRYLINLTIPSSTADKTLEYNPCYVYDVDGTEENATMVPCTSWVYDTSVLESTFASEQNMVCDDKWRRSPPKTILFAGVLIGSFCLGSLADIIGRKKAQCLSFMVLIPSSLAISWATSYTVFCVLMFVIGMSNAGIFTSAYIICAELVGPQKRVFVGNVKSCCFALSLMVMSGIGYFLRHWKYISIACSAPCVFFISYWILLPESVRWYIGKGNIDGANKIIKRAAKVNKVTLTSLLDKRTHDSDDRQQGRVWHLFSSRPLLLRSLVIFFNWMVVCMSYYGLSFNVGNLAGDFYLNLLFNGLVEIPAYTMVIVLLDRVGRSRFYCATTLLGGAFCISTIFTSLYVHQNLQIITVTLAMLGKLFITASFSVVYVWTTELFPTVVRNTSLGLGSASARVGGMIAPYVADLSTYIDGNVGRAAPMSVFGTMIVLGGLLALYLPDTVNEELHDTIQEINISVVQKDKKDQQMTDVTNKEFEVSNLLNDL